MVERISALDSSSRAQRCATTVMIVCAEERGVERGGGARYVFIGVVGKFRERGVRAATRRRGGGTVRLDCCAMGFGNGRVVMDQGGLTQKRQEGNDERKKRNENNTLLEEEIFTAAGHTHETQHSVGVFSCLFSPFVVALFNPSPSSEQICALEELINASPPR